MVEKKQKQKQNKNKNKNKTKQLGFQICTQPKLSMFWCAISKLSTLLKSDTWLTSSKLSEKLKTGINISVGHAVPEYWSKY